MPEGVQFLSRPLIDATIERARESPRRRVNYNLHGGPEDNPHRFLNVFLRHSYVAPHRHLDPPKSETFLVLEGHMAACTFDDRGAVTGRYLLGPRPPASASQGGFEYAGTAIDLAPGVWHTVTAVSEVAVCFEVKPGPWLPATDKEFASWAPREGEPGVAEYLATLLAGCAV
jgi:cupin fold WbuC family metalloprotein